MKKILLVGLVALTGIAAGCKKIKQLANIDVTIPYSQQVSVPQVAGDTAGVPLPPGGVSLPFPAFPVVTNSQQYIAQYKTSTGKIVSFGLGSMVIDILSPASQNFNFLDSIQIFISANNQPEVLVAYQYAVPKGATMLNLYAVPNVNLKNYFIQDTMYFRVSSHINAVPASGTQLNIVSAFNLVANPLD